MVTEKNFHYLYRLGKRTRPFFFKKNRFYSHYHKSGRSDVVNNSLYSSLQSGQPLMVTRFGSIESAAITNFLINKKISNDFYGILMYLTG